MSKDYWYSFEQIEDLFIVDYDVLNDVVISGTVEAREVKNDEGFLIQYNGRQVAEIFPLRDKDFLRRKIWEGRLSEATVAAALGVGLAEIVSWAADRNSRYDPNLERKNSPVGRDVVLSRFAYLETEGLRVPSGLKDSVELKIPISIFGQIQRIAKEYSYGESGVVQEVLLQGTANIQRIQGIGYDIKRLGALLRGETFTFQAAVPPKLHAVEDAILKEAPAMTRSEAYVLLLLLGLDSRFG